MMMSSAKFLSGLQGVFNVRDFGAVGDGETDDSDAIQRTLDIAATCNGIAWLAPVFSSSDNNNDSRTASEDKKKTTMKGYLCTQTLTIPRNTVLKGAAEGMRRPMSFRPSETQGSTLLVGDIDATEQQPFITMQGGSIIDGIEILYLHQVKKLETGDEPKPYGHTIEVPVNEHGCTIRNVNCANPYRFIGIGLGSQSNSGADGIMIDSIQGYPLFRGIEMGRVADVPRIENVQFNANNWGHEFDQSLKDWVCEHGCALEMSFVEEFMVDNFFAIGYRRGVWFHSWRNEHKNGSYGSINNFGFDKVNMGIFLESTGITDRQGLSLSNGRIIPFYGEQGSRVGIKFGEESTGLLSVTNVSFFSHHERSYWIGENSTARLVVFGGQCTEFAKEMLLNESAKAKVRLVSVRSFNPSGPRARGNGSANIEDIGGIIDDGGDNLNVQSKL